MGWFGHKNETGENDNPESNTLENETETNELEDVGDEEKLNPSERDKARTFRDSLRVEPNEAEDSKKLDTGNSDEEDSIKGNSERSHTGGRTDEGR